MDIQRIFIATLVATTLMTTFSYFVSEAFHKLFMEPSLLKYLMKLLKIHLTGKNQTRLAWFIHYAIGLIFVIGYEIVLGKYKEEVNWGYGFAYGFIIAIIGIIGWKIMFSIPSEKPKVNYKEYYAQLFIAHIVFGLSVVWVYKIVC